MFKIGKMPNWFILGDDGLGYYGLPDVDNDGLKIGLHCDDPNFYSKFKNDHEYIEHMKILYMKKV